MRLRAIELSCDRIVSGGIISLLLFTPLAFGSVHLRAYSTMEAVIFGLVVVWMAKLTLARDQTSEIRGPIPEVGDQRSDISDRISGQERAGRLWLPLGLFILLCLFQLVPLPPEVLRVLSPKTYDLYTRVLPGWPEQVPYGGKSMEHGARSMEQGAGRIEDGGWNTEQKKPTSLRRGSGHAFLPRIAGEDKGGGATSSDSGSMLPAPCSMLCGTWLPLSLAPSLTERGLLKFVAYAAVFFLVLLYPCRTLNREGLQKSPFIPLYKRGMKGDLARYEARPEERFLTSVLLAILLSGILISVIGVVQRFLWNGKILGFFVPVDWGIPNLGGNRASGPFVNPDHFAGYLLLILPITVACSLSATSLRTRDKRWAFRLGSGFAATVLCSGILLSVSRSGWLSAVLAVGILVWALHTRGYHVLPLPGKLTGTIVASVVIVCALAALSLLLLGSGGGSQIEARLHELMLPKAGPDARFALWKDTVRMVADFPLLGAGLGSWADLFPHYQSAPWSSWIYREAHNDYLELLSQVGLVGFALLGWFFIRCAALLLRNLRFVPNRLFPVYAALLSSLGIMAFQELFDFNLQIPANALLFTILLALALRIGLSSDVRTPVSAGPFGEAQDRLGVTSRSPRVLATAVAGFAFVLFLLSVGNELAAQSGDPQQTSAVDEAKERVLSRPARADLRIKLVKQVENSAPAAWQLRELESALWLDPLNPHIRDFYAWTLLRLGKNEEALKQVTRSIFNSPSLATHFYLADDAIPLLSDAEKQAIEAGFKHARDREYAGSAEGLGGFYSRLGRFADEAEVYAEAARRTRKTAVKAVYLLNAGVAYAKAKEDEKAEALLREAAVLLPQDPRPYHELATGVFAARGDLDGAKAVVSEAVRKGAHPLSLYMSLAEAAHKVGDHDEEKVALLTVLDLRPSSFDAVFRLANLYMEDREYDEAALYFTQAGNIDPNSASAFFHLGMAEEARYGFSAAGEAYARALQLAPQSHEVQQALEALKRKIAQNANRVASEHKG